MSRFLIELLVCRTWFGQFDELYFVLNWLVMRCKFSPNLRQTRSIQHDRKCRLKSSQYTLIIPHRVIQLTTISFWVPETRLRLPQVNKFPLKRVKNLATPSGVIHFYFFFILRRALLSANQRQCSSNRAKKSWPS